MSENTEDSDSTHYDFRKVKQFMDLEEIAEILGEQNHENCADLEITLDRFQPFLEKMGEPNGPEPTVKILILLKVIREYATIMKNEAREENRSPERLPPDDAAQIGFWYKDGWYSLEVIAYCVESLRREIGLSFDSEYFE